MDFALRRMASRSLALGPTQVRCDFSSLASGEFAGNSHVMLAAHYAVPFAGAALVALITRAFRWEGFRNGESLVQVVNDVLGVFYSHANPNESGQHTGGNQLLLAQLGVGG